MKLYTVRVAPNPTRVDLYLAEKREGGAKIPVEDVFVNLMKGEQNQPEHRERNPFAAVPVLEVGNGDYLLESLSIIEYLEECYPDPAMWGADPKRRAQARAIERVAELRVLQPIGRLVHATNSPTGRPPNTAVAEEARSAMPKGLEYFDALLSDGRPFLAGDRVTVGDCTLAAAMQFSRFRDVEIDQKYANVLAWDARYRERPAAKAILIK
ncbi:MAG: glutathione S-transferase family protein [Pseudomonadota bacterium]